MYCSECGHNNPAANRFCGMCGARMSPSSEPRTPEVASEGPGVQVAPLAAETAAAVAEPGGSIVGRSQPPEVASEYSPPRGYGFLRAQTAPAPEVKETVAEPTTVSGPSFLGLSEPAPGEEEGYSYLFEDEKPSRVGRFVLLIVLMVLGTGIYLKWQPLKSWVLNTALSHIQPPNERKAVTPNSEPTITSATPPSEPSGNLPAVEQTVKPSNGSNQADKDAGIEPAKAAGAAGSPERADVARSGVQDDATPDKAATNAPAPPVKPEAPEAEKKGKKPESPSNGAAAAVGKKSAAAPSKSAAALRLQSKPPAPPEGSELVAAGEKFLYGRGVVRNCGQAVNYFRAAANKHNVRAYSHLGSLYATGQCVPLDRAQAYSYFSRALAEDRSNPYYERNLTMLWRDMTGEERARATRGRSF